MHMRLLVVLLVGSIGVYAAQLWPQPQVANVGNSRIQVPTSLQFVCQGPSCSSTLTAAFDRYRKYIFFAGTQGISSFVTSRVAVFAQSKPPLQLYVDESYELQTNGSNYVIRAKTEWGALRALETFSQLVEWNSTTDQYFIDSYPFYIYDYPRFPWRGLLIDTSRHYLPLDIIRKNLDAMASSKMNVLHWHIVDDQSFPLQSSVYPKLSQLGAWSPKAVYSLSDVASIVNYATSLGIRVVPEFDTPGHATCWGRGYPQLFPSSCNANTGLVFDVTSDYVYKFMLGLLQEVTSVFTDDFFHLGGDEVSFDCWNSSEAVTLWMQQHGVSSFYDLQGYYEQRMQIIVSSFQKSSVYWNEVINDISAFPLSKDAVIQVWNKPVSEMASVVKQGFRALFSTPWYLDRQVPGNKEHWFWMDTWKDFYSADPIGNQTLTPDELKLVLGGETCMWGEQVDETSFEVRVWPRAAATAERLWSAQNVTDVNAATPRLGTHRCRMVRRGIRASPIYPDYCETGNN